jgi:hypothetical protein
LLGFGHNAVHGGVFVKRNLIIKDVEVEEAVQHLKHIFRDFYFETQADEARAYAALITPALQFGGMVKGACPIIVLRAKVSQTGKNYFVKLLGYVYGCYSPAIATNKDKNGVGSFEENLSRAYETGKPFMSLENVRGIIDCQALESSTTEGVMLCRVPYKAPFYVDVSRVVKMITSNGLVMTPDLANRSVVVNLRKEETEWWRSSKGTRMDDYVRGRTSFFLGCIHAVVRAWVDAGKPRLEVRREEHDFQDWAGAVSWIVQELFEVVVEGGMFAGHKEIKEELANPNVGWVREWIGVVTPNKILRATDIYIACIARQIKLSSGPKQPDERTGMGIVGNKMKGAFGEADSIVVSGLKLVRRRYTWVNDNRVRKEGVFYVVDAGCDWGRVEVDMVSRGWISA